MSVLAFDTYQAVTALKQAGFEESQAEAVVTTMGAALGGQVATKADLAEVRTALEAALEQLRSETKADLAAGEQAGQNRRRSGPPRLRAALGVHRRPLVGQGGGRSGGRSVDLTG